MVQRDDDRCNSLRSTKNRFGLHCHPSVCLALETRPILLEDLHALRLVGLDPIFRWICGKPDLLQTSSPFHLRSGKCSQFFSVLISFALCLRAGISDASKFSSPQRLRPKYHAHPRNIPGKTSLPNWWSLDLFLAEIG